MPETHRINTASAGTSILRSRGGKKMKKNKLLMANETNSRHFFRVLGNKILITISARSGRRKMISQPTGPDRNSPPQHYTIIPLNKHLSQLIISSTLKRLSY